MTEHKGAINQICVSPDHNFFASCSDDGTVKIWDCSRFVKNFNNRSRVTYNQQGIFYFINNRIGSELAKFNMHTYYF